MNTEISFVLGGHPSLIYQLGGDASVPPPPRFRFPCWVLALQTARFRRWAIAWASVDLKLSDREICNVSEQCGVLLLPYCTASKLSLDLSHLLVHFSSRKSIRLDHASTSGRPSLLPVFCLLLLRLVYGSTTMCDYFDTRLWLNLVS